MSKDKHIKISELIPDDKNFNKGSQFGNSLIEKSFTKFGAGRSILLDKNNRIIAGNKSVENASAIGMEDVQIVESDGKRIIAVKRTDIDLDTPEGREMALADNASAKANIVFDAELVEAEVGEAVCTEWGIETSVKLEAQEDDFDGVPPNEPITVFGDLYELNEHRLHCADSCDSDAVAKLMNGLTPDAIVTDPPYGIGVDGQKKSINKNPKHNRKAHEFMNWDNERPDEGVFNFIVSLSIPTVIWGGNYFADLLPATRGWIYWNKGQDGLTMSDGELAWTTESKPLRSVTVNRGELNGSVHPTQKPNKVIKFSLDYINAGKHVIDFFGGSGTTAIVCDDTERVAYLMEMQPKYCDVIVARYIKHRKETGSSLVIKRNGQQLSEDEINQYIENTHAESK